MYECVCMGTFPVCKLYGHGVFREATKHAQVTLFMVHK